MNKGIFKYGLIIPNYVIKRQFQKINRKILKDKSKYLLPTSSDDYNIWLKNNKISPTKKRLKYKPTISVVMPVYNVPIEYLEECIESVLNQTYSNWELCIADDCSTDKNIKKTLNKYKKMDKRIKVVFRKENGHISLATNSALKLATGEFIGLIDNDDILDSNALYEVVKALNNDKNIDMLYTDEDKITLDGVYCEPNFKPDFSHDAFLSQNYICHFTVLRKSIVDKIGGFRQGFEGAQDYDLFLRFYNETDKICHIPKILYHWRMIPGSTAVSISNKDYACERGRNAIKDFLKERKIEAEVDYFNTTYNLKYTVDDNDAVAIILNGKFNKKRIDATIKNIINNTDYKNYIFYVNTKKISGIDNSLSKKIVYADIDTNYIENNIKCKFICFYEIGNILNCDSDWLKILTGYANQEHIGLAAGKVLFKNDFIKNSAYIIGKKDKKYIVKDCFKGVHKEAEMSSGRLLTVYNYMAVNNRITVGLKNRIVESLPNDKCNYNNIELSLNLVKKEYLNVLIPYVEVKNYKNIEHNKRMVKKVDKYNDLFENDKFYNQNYSVDKPFFLK